MKKVFIWTGIAILVAVCLYYGARMLLSRKNKGSSSLPIGNIVTVERGDIVRTVSAFGEVAPNREASLHFMSSGIIKEIFVEEGDKVKKDQILASLNNSQQEAQLLQAKNAYERAKVDSPKSEIEEKRLSYEAAYENYQKTLVRAPFAGEITDLPAHEGDSVSSSTTIISLINRDKMYVEIDVDEVDIREVAIGQEAVISFDAYPDLKLPARVDDISRTAANKGGITVVEVTLELIRFDERIKPGFSAEAEITVAEAQGVLRIPVEAIVERNGRSLVSIITEDDLKPAPVKVGISNEEYAQVLSGLREGDRILANNYQLFEEFKKLEGRGEERPFREGMMPFRPPEKRAPSQQKKVIIQPPRHEDTR